MMFIRHGMFARRSTVERRRELIVIGVVGLLLVLSATIFAVVKAAQGEYKLEYTSDSDKGLTDGNITGTLANTDGGSAQNINRDGKVKLNLEFNILNEMVSDAKDADTWTYDLSSISSANNFISSVDDITTPIEIVNDGVVIATYKVVNNKVTITLKKDADATNWWNTHTNNVKVGLSVNLNIDKVYSNAHTSDYITIPGAKGATTNNVMYYSSPRVYVHEEVKDEGSSQFKSGNYDQLISVAEDNGNYIATYNTNFFMNGYDPNMRVDIELGGDQSFVSGSDFYMTTCTTDNCIDDSSKTKIAIPSTYITLSDNNTKASINIEAFLYDYCELGSRSDCADATIAGYILNNTMNANNGNGSDYYIEYKANLGATDPAGNGKSYTAKATITNGSTLTATDTVKYSVGIPGSKTGTCRFGTTAGDSGATCNRENGTGDAIVNYTITVGASGTDLSKTTIFDRITDNQVLVGDITLTGQRNGNPVTITIANGTTCASDSDNDCIVSAAVDTNYSSNDQKLFSHAFTSGDTGIWTVSYSTKIATDAELNNKEVNNKIDLQIDQTTYYDVWKTSTRYDFATPMYIEKVEDYTLSAEGKAHWTITVYGPTSGSLSNLVVTEALWYDKGQYPAGAITNSIDIATLSVNGGSATSTSNYSTGTDANGNLLITIPQINANEVYTFGILSEANAAFIEAYEGSTIQLMNQACRVVDGDESTRKCSEQVRTTILPPDPEVIEKTVQADNDIFYWNQEPNNHKYVYGRRKGFIWSVTINPEAGSLPADENYEPYFSDVIPEGLYLTYRYNQNGMPEPTCVNETCDASVDINQDKYSAVVSVERRIPSIAGTKNQYIEKVAVEVENGVIKPLNLAALFNTGGCDVTDGSDPTLDCAGINGAIYTITYATAIADEVYFDYGSEQSFSNIAKLYKATDVAGVYTEINNDVTQVTFKNDSAIEKSDPTSGNLESTNKITYVITVNKAGYAYMNNGTPYQEGDTRQMITVQDQIPEDVNIMTTAFAAASNLDWGVIAPTGATTPIVCTDINNTIVNDCEFNYDSETRVLTAEIPDGLVRKIWYNVVVANPVPNKNSDYSNTASFTANSVTFSSTATRSHTVNGDSGYIIGNGVMKIKKVNAANLGENVAGAKFKLVQVEYDPSNGGLGTETVIDLNGSEEGTDGSTGSDGVIEFNSLCGYSTDTPTAGSDCPNGGRLYYWQEVSAPVPYIPTNGTTTHYFVLYDEKKAASDTEVNKAIAQRVANIIMENGTNSSNNVVVETLKSNYQWVVTNIKQEETSIAIEKKITGNGASVDDTFTITITATDLAGNPLTGEFKYDTYETRSPDSTQEEASTITFVNGVATQTLQHGRGIVIHGVYVGGTYTVTEGNNAYNVSYICADKDADTGCESGTSNNGVFVANDSTQEYPAVSEVGQKVTLTNDRSIEITGISNKKPSVAIAVIFGSTVAGLGIFIARKFRH